MSEARPKAAAPRMATGRQPCRTPWIDTLMRLDWASLLELLRRTRRFVLTSHIRPDCDALGSELGLAAGLEALGRIDGIDRDVRIVNAQATPRGLACLDVERRIESLEQGVTAADLADRELLIVLDTSATAQLGGMAEVAAGMRDKVLVIDHHVGEDDISDRWFKDTSAEATARIVAEIVMRLGVPLDPRIATPLFAGLATDTGWFRFPNATGETFRLASRLVDAGTSPTTLYRDLFEQETLARLHLVGRTLAGAVASHDGRVILSTVRQEDFRVTGAVRSDTEDLVNQTLTVKGTELAAILIEQNDGTIKASFRSRTGIDCSRLAGRFGGGGHKAAAGATLPGPFEAALEAVQNAVDEAWTQHVARSPAEEAAVTARS
jgi:phosphoesterase RecJ-like protein